MALKRTIRKAIRKKTGNKKSSTSSGNGFTYILFGTLFGYFLSKARATDYDTVVDMFKCQDFQLYGVIIVAIAVVSLGLVLLRRSGRPTLSGKAMDWEDLKWDPARLGGAFLFGAGWALAGTCPGTSLTQIGEGKLVAFATVIGILAGVWAYKKFMPTSAKDQVC